MLELEDVAKVFGKTPRAGGVRAVGGVNIEIQEGEFFTLLGPSGCGKTTTLRMVAGLERLDEGRIRYRGNVIADPARRIHLPPHKRSMGMVFQSYAIWPHMTVFENVAFPLRLRGVKGSDLRKRVEDALELVDLASVIDRPAPKLSGGQQQRVAVARALVYEPDLLLLDEPFSNLDAKLRSQMRVEIKLLQRKVGCSVLFVTHDQVEALTLSDRIAVMNGGLVEQIDSPVEMYDHPSTQFVRDFLGHTVILPGKLGDASDGGFSIALGADQAGSAIIRGQAHSLSSMAPGDQVVLAIRPENIAVTPESPAGDPAPPNCCRGVIEVLLFVGDRYEAGIRLPTGDQVLLHLSRNASWSEGQSVILTFPLDRTYIWPR